MVDHTELAEGENMCIDDSRKRSRNQSFKFKLCKKIIRISSNKFDDIEDSETEIHRCCLIRNTLKLLRREAREEKLASYRASVLRPRSPSPEPHDDMEVADVLSHYGQHAPSPITALSDDEDELPPRKRSKLFIDDYDDEEDDDVGQENNENNNSIGDQYIDVEENKVEPQDMDDTQKNHTEEYVENSVENSNLSSNPLNASNSCCDDRECLSPSGSLELSRPYQKYHCRHSALQGSDLQSVVYHSLITSLQ